MNKEKAKDIQVLSGGIYQNYEVTAKYGLSIELPHKYTIVVIPD